MRSLAAVALVVAVACQKSAAPSYDAGVTTTTSCSSIVASYDALVASGGACASDADCTCFKGGVSLTTPCGDVTDKATSAKLDKLVTDYESARCNSLMCAASVCTPSCNSGHCANGPPAVIAAASADAAAIAASRSWTSCTTDADCTYASLGCCETTPVNRAHAADMQRKLEHSGHAWCPVKTACGPSTNGTWSGAPGKCAAGNCVLRSW